KQPPADPAASAAVREQPGDHGGQLGAGRPGEHHGEPVSSPLDQVAADLQGLANRLGGALAEVERLGDPTALAGDSAALHGTAGAWRGVAAELRQLAGTLVPGVGLREGSTGATATWPGTQTGYPGAGTVDPTAFLKALGLAALAMTLSEMLMGKGGRGPRLDDEERRRWLDHEDELRRN